MKTKTLLLFTLLAFFLFFILPSASKAEDHGKKGVASIAPLGSLNKFRVKGEYAVTKWGSVGLQFSYYYGLYPGVQGCPFARFYIGSVAPQGFYLQPFLVMYSHKSPAFEYSDEKGFYRTDNRFRISGLGFGGAVGYQWLLGYEKNIVIDLNAGVKSFNINNDISSDIIWYTTGPGSYFAGTVQIGYAF